MNVDDLHRWLMACYSALNNLLNDYPKGCKTDLAGETKQLFESYCQLSSTGYLESGKDSLASGVVEVGDRITSSSGRMIAQISYEVLEAIFQAATKRPVAFCEFEPHLDSNDWMSFSKLSQTKIQAIAKTTAAMNTTKLDGIMRRMLAELETVEASTKKAEIVESDFQSLSNIQFWKALQSNLRGTQKYVEEARSWRTSKNVDRESAKHESTECDKLANSHRTAFNSQWGTYQAFSQHVEETAPSLVRSLPVADGEDILAIDPKQAALDCRTILASMKQTDAKPKSPAKIDASKLLKKGKAGNLEKQKRKILDFILGRDGVISYSEIRSAIGSVAEDSSTKRELEKVRKAMIAKFYFIIRQTEIEWTKFPTVEQVG